MNIVILSGHYYNSKKKAGFHFIADELSKDKDNKVVFISTAYNLKFIFSKKFLASDNRFKKNVFFNENENNLKSIINISIMTPTQKGNKYIQLLSILLYNLNIKAKREIKKADYIIFESTYALLFFEKIKRMNSKAKIIYRMSDDINALKYSKYIINYEKKIIKYFNYVSVPSKELLNRKIIYSKNNMEIDFHGIDKSLFDQININPYKKDQKNLIFIGVANLDVCFIDIASSLFPYYYFHIIGQFKNRIKKTNVIYYGEMEYKKTIPYIQFADIGLHTIECFNDHAKTFSDSLKVIQYTYCKLPIIAPEIIEAKHRNNFIYYKYKDIESIRESINNAIRFDRNIIDKSTIISWDTLARKLISK